MDEIERRVRDTVAGLADVEVVDCDPALADTAEFCAAYGYELDDSANAIVVIGKPSRRRRRPVYVACVVLASTRLDVNRVVRKRLGDQEGVVRARRRDGRDHRHGHRRRDAVRPPGRPPLWIDARVMAARAHRRRRGSRAAKVVGPPSMLLTVPGAEVVEDLAQPR